ncbi:MAG TPA: M14 family metallopeptidase [Albitalea sp.]
MSMSPSRLRWGPVGLVLAALFGCAADVPPPPRPVEGIAPPTRVVPPEAARAAASSPAASAPGAVAFPVTGAAAAAPVPASAPAAPTYVETPEVAARFPDPPVDYATPAFQPGRAAYTTNEEVQAFLRGLVREPRADGGTAVRLLALGTSQTGAPIEALLFTRLADADPAAVVRSGRLTVLLVGQQHGDEPASGEAMLAVAQELARGRLEPLLERINVIVLPRANPDGARDGRRLTASGIDANRDHLLLRTPEAQAQARLVREFRPAVILDAHEYAVGGRVLEKFGALQPYDAMVQYAMTANLHEFITRAAEEWFRRPLVARLKAEGFSSEWYHTTSADPADRKFSMGGVHPDNGRNVNGLRNAVSLLVETRGVGLGRQHYRRRVHTHVVALASVLQSAHERAADLAKLRQFVDAEVSARACQGESVVEAAPTPSEYALRFMDPQTGVDRNLTVAWDSALALRPVKSRTRPCGYWLAASLVDAVTRLRGLGVTVQQLAEDGDLRTETYRETARETGVRTDVRGTVADAGSIVRVKVETVPTLIDVKAGGYYVPLDQPLAHLVFAALEPDTQSSYVAHGIVDRLDNLARVMGLPTMRLTALP